jgi:hypothetical protein
MAGNSNDYPKFQSQNLKLRKAFNDAYAAVEGQKVAQSFSAVTFEELADQQIQRISGSGTPSRPNELDRVQKVLNNVLQAVEQVKGMPPESFQDPDPNRDVNTPP